MCLLAGGMLSHSSRSAGCWPSALLACAKPPNASNTGTAVANNIRGLFGYERLSTNFVVAR